MANSLNSRDVKSQLLEFDDDKNFMRQLLITEKAKKSLVKPKIGPIETGLNLNLIENVKKFLEDAKHEKSQLKEEQPAQIRLENEHLTEPNLEENFEIGSPDKQELGVEFDLLMYEEDSDSEEESEESDQDN